MSNNYMDDELLINARKPVGKLGDELIDCMNENHEGLAQWSLNHLDISKDSAILDIGCGGGVNVKRFLDMTDNMVFGLDYSKLAVERSGDLNQSAIDDGRCKIVQGTVSKMPFNDNTFDIVTAFETVYFLPDFLNDLKEIRRVLKDGGMFFIANEAQPLEGDERQKHIIELLDMNIYSGDELSELLTQAGFGNVECHVKHSNDSFTGEDADWVCLIAVNGKVT